MKVAFFTVLFLEHGGGLEKYFIETASSLAKMPSILADVITMDDKFAVKIMKLLQIFYMTKINMKSIFKEKTQDIKNKLGKAHYYKIDYILNLKKKLKEYDVIYSKNEVLEAFILKILIGYENLPPVIFGCHTPFHYPLAKSLQSKFHNFLYSSFIYKFLTSGVKTFHVTNTLDEIYLNKLFSDKKISKIYNPLHSYDFTKSDNKCKYAQNWDRTKPNALWIGRFTEQKGVPELLWIINELNGRGYSDKIIFNIIGDGNAKSKKNVAVLKKRWGNINYFGYVQNKYLPIFYQNSDFVISTSRWESFGLTMLEAQAFGLPAISFNIPGPRDIIIDNETGFLAENKSDYVKKIIKIVDERSLFQKNNIIKSVQERFGKEGIYKKFIALLKQALADHG